MSLTASQIVDEERQEQLRMLVDSAAGIAPRHGDFRRQRALRFTTPGIDRAVWSDIAAMGWLGLRLPESAGGAGLGALEYAALATEAGAALLPEPFIEAQLAVDLMGAATPGAVLSGDEIILPAWSHAADGFETTAGVTVEGGRLTGEKHGVPMAAAADRYLVTTGAGLFLVAASDVTLTHAFTQDGGHVATLRFDGAAGEAVEPGNPPAAAFGGAAFDGAALANSAFLLGAMERAFDITLDYLKTRQQFGRPIGSFQVLQHRAVELKVQIEVTRAVVRDACRAIDAGNAAAGAAVSRAVSRAGDAAMLVTRQAIQLHGAIGYTDEADIGLFLRKTLTLVNRYGSPGAHRARHAALTGGV